MIVHDVEQGSAEWLRLRCGIVTASELNALVSPTLKLREGDGVDTYLATKIAEKWLGRPVHDFRGGAMAQGTILEPDAVKWYEMEYATDVRRVGFVTDDAGTFGASPDGLLPSKGLEIKCPLPHTHVGYLLDGGVPAKYQMQLQGGMYATGLAEWDFVSYCRGFPALVVTARRDERAMEAIAKAVAEFNSRMEQGYARLVEANGGEPVRAAAPVTADAMDESHIF